MKSFGKIALFVWSALSLWGCVNAIHEFPCESSQRSVNMRITQFFIDSRIDPYIVPSPSSSVRSLPASCKIRFTVNICLENIVIESRQIIETPKEDRTYPVDIRFELQQKEYTLAVWAEYVNEQGVSLGYHSENLLFITQKSPYAGSTETKDAFSLSLPLDLRQAPDEVEQQLTLTRPFGKFRIVSTDWEKYLANKSLTAEQISKMKVKLYYTGFCPSSFNVVADKPNDAATGIVFEGRVEPCNDPSGLQLAFDYIWVNGTESGVSVQMEIFDHNGALIATTLGIDVPYKRQHLTTITGAFLTADSGSGISIHTEFDGVFDIYIPD